MKKSVSFCLAIACAALLSSPAWAQIYRTTDADGNVIFTDTPPPGGSSEQVQLQRTNTAKPTAVPPPVEPETAETEEEALPPQTVVITSPANEETIPMGKGGNFSVVARVEPSLEKGESLRLSLDGTPSGKLQQSGFWDLTNVDRGGHDLSVAVIDASGKVLSESKPVRVYVIRASVNRPAQ